MGAAQNYFYAIRCNIYTVLPQSENKARSEMLDALICVNKILLLLSRRIEMWSNPVVKTVFAITSQSS